MAAKSPSSGNQKVEIRPAASPTYAQEFKARRITVGVSRPSFSIEVTVTSISNKKK